MFFLQVVAHGFHAVKEFVTYLTIIPRIFTMLEQFMMHQLFLTGKFFLTLITLKFFEKPHAIIKTAHLKYVAKLHQTHTSRSME